MRMNFMQSQYIYGVCNTDICDLAVISLARAMDATCTSYDKIQHYTAGIYKRKDYRIIL